MTNFIKIILDYTIFIFRSKFNLFKNISGWKEVRYQHQSDLKNKDRDNGKTHLRKDKQNKMSPARNYPEEPAKTFFPPGIDESAAKKALKRKKKRNSKKNKTSKATPSGTSEKSEIRYSIFDISISEDSDDAVNIDTNENQLPDDPANDGEDDIMVSQDSEKSTTDEQIQDKDVNAADMEDVGSDNEYERQENYLCVQCMTYFWSKEELDKHEISTHSQVITHRKKISLMCLAMKILRLMTMRLILAQSRVRIRRAKKTLRKTHLMKNQRNL